jgi:murein DD-endopeptidase MepM/ murein hydrolase activator NlpD
VNAIMRRLRFPLLLISTLAAAALGAPAITVAAEATAPSVPATTTAPAGEAAPAPTTSAPGAAEPAAPPAPTEAGATEATPPQVQSQHAQSASPSGSAHRSTHAKLQAETGGEAAEASEESTGPDLRAKHRAVSPSALTPSLPAGLQSAIGGVSSFFIESFAVPPFLLPIFQAAGTAYGIPWQVLAAINEVETDYGRDLSISSAGAEGWMQFLPGTWSGYGVDANGDGFEDPYNPADAIFAAAKYLRAAGGDKSIKAAIFSYNHSQAYVETVMLRAQLLGATPSELLGAITGLTEARFPVHAAAHFSDGFPTAPTAGAGTKTLVGTTIYSQPGAPVIAVQDGEIVQIGDSPTLGHFVSLRDAFGNTYVYAQLADVSSVYPVLEPRVHTAVSPRIEARHGAEEPAPSGPATAGAQPRSPLSEGATVTGLALGATASFEPAPLTPADAAPVAPPATQPAPAAKARVFAAGEDDVFLHTLRAGVQVIAGTVLGHLAAPGAGSGAAGADAPHMLFQIRPAGAGAPLIDPKPILDGWVALENTSIFRAKGENPFLATSPTVGQVLLESKQQLQPQVLHDHGIHLSECGRQDVQGGRVDKRVLAMLEYLSVSGLNPTVSGLKCGGSTTAQLASNRLASETDNSVKITAINGISVAGHQGAGSVTDTAVRKLLMLQGLTRPRRIVSLTSYPGDADAFASVNASSAIRVSYSAPLASGARAARALASGLAPAQWIKLIARLGEIPDPTVGHGPSSAAITDKPGTAEAGGEKGSGGNH